MILGWRCTIIPSVSSPGSAGSSNCVRFLRPSKGISNTHKLPGSDPRAGTAPSVLNSTAILTGVSLYYLTNSFLSSVWIYALYPTALSTVYTKAPTDAPMLFSQYEYNTGLWPEEYVAKVGNLVSYKGASVLYWCALLGRALKGGM